MGTTFYCHLNFLFEFERQQKEKNVFVRYKSHLFYSVVSIAFYSFSVAYYVEVHITLYLTPVNFIVGTFL